MSYQVNFLDNQLVTADVVNAISEELGGSASDFADDMTYGTDDLNQISGSLISKGVSRGCELIASDGTVTVSAGVLFMSDGKRVEIDEEGVTLSYEPGLLHYVWFYQDALTGFVAPRCTTTEPEGNDYVMLGKVDEDGNVVGHADKAVMKHANFGLNHAMDCSFQYEWNNTDFSETLIAEIEPDQVGYQYAIVYCDDYALREQQYNCFCGFVNLISGESYSTMSTFLYATDNFGAGFIQSPNQEGKLLVGICESKPGGLAYAYLRLELGTDGVLRAYRSGLRMGWSLKNMPPSNVTIKIHLC